MSNTAPVENEQSAEASPARERRDLLDVHEAAHRDLGEHVLDVRFGHLLEDLGLRRRRRQAVHQHARLRQLLAERLGERDAPAWREYATALGLPS